MDFLDSRFLTAQDGFVHAFRQPGEYAYVAAGSEQHAEAAGVIVVEKGDTAPGEGMQHDVVFRWDACAHRFVVEQGEARCVIRQNDFVVFQFDQPVTGQPPCFVRGLNGRDIAFDSRHLRTHEAYSHFFLAPGEYSYRIGRERCTVTVADHRNFPGGEHEERAREPLLIFVKGAEVSVRNARVVAGQTVVWAIESGEDVAIIAAEHRPAAGSVAIH